jgi:TPP-dependent pyruvate/acetoin dehydrogenase alpha subunit
MAYECGIVKESIRYASGHDLPIKFIIEDNGMSVTTKTQEVWGTKNKDVIIKYKYEREYPHAGIGKFILF